MIRSVLKSLKNFVAYIVFYILLISIFLMMAIPLLMIWFFDWLFEDMTVDKEPWGRW